MALLLQLEAISPSSATLTNPAFTVEEKCTEEREIQDIFVPHGGKTEQHLDMFLKNWASNTSRCNQSLTAALEPEILAEAHAEFRRAEIKRTK
ncbi:uncharacterized [Tachysurus ichikawai]